MEEGLWEDYEDDEENEPYDRGPITSELELPDTELREVEEILDSSPDDAFNEHRDPEETEIESGSTHGGTDTEGETVYLDAFRDISQATLAHESVHGLMNQPDGSVNLPGDDPWDALLYEEFVARKAELEFKDSEVESEDLRTLARSKRIYENAKEEKGIETNAEGLNNEVREIVDEEVLDAADQYKQKRDTLLAEEAADRHTEYELKDLIDPDIETYNETLDYIKNVEQQIIDEYSPP